MREVRVAAAAIYRDGKIFVTQRGYGPYKDYWEFPGGKIEEGENPKEALVREIREELDTDIEIVRRIADVSYDYPDFHLYMKLYAAKLTGEDPVLNEHEDARWLSRYDLDSVEFLPADREVVRKLFLEWDIYFDRCYFE